MKHPQNGHTLYQGHLFDSGVFALDWALSHLKKMKWGIKVGVYFSGFMTILSHFGFIIFDMTHIHVEKVGLFLQPNTLFDFYLPGTLEL